MNNKEMDIFEKVWNMKEQNMLVNKISFEVWKNYFLTYNLIRSKNNTENLSLLMINDLLSAVVLLYDAREQIEFGKICSRLLEDKVNYLKPLIKDKSTRRIR